MLLTQADVLLVIDVQRDFMPGGRLAIQGGDEIVPVINRLGTLFPDVVLTQDWHPPMHISFASRHGKRPFVDTGNASYGPQALWPDHTVQNEEGAGFHSDLFLPHAGLIVRKGFRRDIDSYSAFLENDRTTPTGLAGSLRERGKRRLFLCGLATDYCVGYSALDGRQLGFEVTVILDAARAVTEDTAAAMRQRWQAAGASEISSSDLIGMDF